MLDASATSAERAARMATMLDTLPGMRDLMQEVGVDSLETRIVDLQTGAFTDMIDADSYDPAQSTAIPADMDVAGRGTPAGIAPDGRGHARKPRTP